jgi:hypothetical protein
LSSSGNSEDKNPLFGKEQARKYALAQHCRFVMLSNGNSHYFIGRFPTPESAARLFLIPAGSEYPGQ